jgi:hypothetical protein
MPIFWGPVGYPVHPVAHQASRDAARAEGAAGRSLGAVHTLEARLERLALITEALWTLLRERVGMTDEQLLERIREVDLSDGVLDGKVRRGTSECPACQRVLSKRHSHCLYCGAEVEREPFQGT